MGAAVHSLETSFASATKLIGGFAVAFAAIGPPAPAVAQDRQPGIRTSSYLSMPERERVAVVVGASHVLARWMRSNGEADLNCFYNRGTYADVVAAVDAYVSDTPASRDQLFSETLIRALAAACATNLDRYLDD